MEQNISDLQRGKIEQIRFLYQKAATGNGKEDNKDLYSHLIDLDESLKKRALAISVTEGVIGFVLLTTGYNLLTHLSHSFLGGIIFFSIGAIALTLSIPVYNFLLRKYRKKYSSVVLAITNFLK